MPAISKAKRNVTVVPAVNAAAKPAVTSAKPARKLATASPKPVKPATVPVIAKPATDAATMPRGLARDAAGIIRQATNFAQYSDRDTAYLAFLGAACRANSGKATLRQIHDSGVTRSGMPDRKRFNPNYTGSGKATDVGAINRLCKAGYFTRSADGNTLTPTALALANAAYRGSKA